MFAGKTWQNTKTKKTRVIYSFAVDPAMQFG